MRSLRRAKYLGEPVLASGRLTSGDALLATALALVVPDQDVRLDWDRIASASWADPTLTVTMSGTREVHEFDVADAGSVPEVIRERVQASILVSEHVALTKEAGARFSARRPLARDAEVRWTVTFDPGLDPADPELRRRAEQALDRLRQTYGV